MSVVLGSLYGDCGKGLATSFLCANTDNPIVVRFNGGHQAGHTVVHNGHRHVFSSFGSGTLQGVPTYWSKYCTFNPTAVMNEYELLASFKPVLYVNPLCPVTTPYDIMYNKMLANKNGHGSVGVGFGATIQRHDVANYKLFVQDLFHEKILVAKLKNIAKYYQQIIPADASNIYEFVYIDHFIETINEVKKIIQLRGDEIIYGFNPIFEGAQGILLDQDFGFFPNVTRSNTTSKNAIEIIRDLKLWESPCNYIPEIFYVTRTYQTRHGNGFMTNEPIRGNIKNNELETNKSHPFQGEFRVSKLDPDLLNYAFECDNNYSKGVPKNLVITCTDQHEIDIDELLSKLTCKFRKVFISAGDSQDKISLYKENKHVNFR